MTEQKIRQIAEAHGLSVLKRVTTGNAAQHFATFELSGSGAGARANAFDELREGETFDAQRMVSFERCTNPASLDWIQQFIRIESVWCAPLGAVTTELLNALKVLVDHAQETYPHFESERGQRDIARALRAIGLAEAPATCL